MGVIMIRCPKTKHAVSTGKRIEPARFHCSPVFFSRTYCPFCRVAHEWFAKDAWVCTMNCDDCSTGCGRRAA